MKAAICYEFGQPLRVEEVKLDPPRIDEIRVKLSACAICHSDIIYMDGGWGGTLPAVYGHEAAGYVIEVGAGVKNVELGDAVVVTLIRSCGSCFYCENNQPYLCETTFRLDREGPIHTLDGRSIYQAMRTGAFAEEVLVHSSQVVRLPDDIPLESAALLACGVITGYGAVVNTADIQPGGKVVVIGAGGVGLNSIQGAVIAGASKIIAIDLLENKLEAARAFGATDTIVGSESDVIDQVKNLTQGRGADYVFVTVGSGKAMQQALSMIRRGGKVVLVGMPASGVKLSIESADFVGDNQFVLGSKMGSTKLAHDIPLLVNLYQDKKLKLDELISQRYPLEQINEAVSAVKRGEALRNVIVFD